MILRQVALLTKSTKVSLQELTRVSAALQRQVSRDLAPIWNVQGTVDAFVSSEDVPPGYWTITVMDTVPAKGAAGFHLDENEQPFADVQWSPEWSLTASHECLEMLVDPFSHQVATGPSPIAGQGRVRFLVEVCDPCEARQFAYTMNTGTAAEVLVSEFYTPEYFSPTQGSGVRYSFRGNLTAPRQVLEGGYLSWQNPADGHVWQLFGPAELKNFKDNGRGTLTREKSDGFARATRAAHAKAVAKRPRARKSLITAAAPGGQCNLTLDTFTGILSGPVGAQTTVQIQDPTKSATFASISYDGTQIGSNVSSASFTIGAGQKVLSFAYNAPVPGDLVNLVDPCAATLDVFANNPGNPFRIRQVVGQ
jgi:hypothetical protein